MCNERLMYVEKVISYWAVKMQLLRTKSSIYYSTKISCLNSYIHRHWIMDPKIKFSTFIIQFCYYVLTWNQETRKLAKSINIAKLTIYVLTALIFYFAQLRIIWVFLEVHWACNVVVDSKKKIWDTYQRHFSFYSETFVWHIRVTISLSNNVTK